MNYNNDNINNNQQAKLMDFRVSEKSSGDCNKNCDNNMNNWLKDLKMLNLEKQRRKKITTKKTKKTKN